MGATLPAVATTGALGRPGLLPGQPCPWRGPGPPDSLSGRERKEGLPKYSTSKVYLLGSWWAWLSALPLSVDKICRDTPSPCGHWDPRRPRVPTRPQRGAPHPGEPARGAAKAPRGPGAAGCTCPPACAPPQPLRPLTARPPPGGSCGGQWGEQCRRRPFPGGPGAGGSPPSSLPSYIGTVCFFAGRVSPRPDCELPAAGLSTFASPVLTAGPGESAGSAGPPSPAGRLSPVSPTEASTGLGT